MRRGSRLGVISVLVLVLAGCSAFGGSDDPPPTDASSVADSAGSATRVSASGSGAALGPDRSSLVSEFTVGDPVATTAGAGDTIYAGGTFLIYSVESTKTSTRLLFAFDAKGHGGENSLSDPRLWTHRFPVMETATNLYQVWTFTSVQNAEKENPSAVDVYCVCEFYAQTPKYAPPLVSGLYPALPVEVSSVTLTSPWFADVTVPVTHK